MFTSLPVRTRCVQVLVFLWLVASLVNGAATPAIHQANYDQQLENQKHSVKLRDEWSSIMGWVSIACWVLPSFSQIYENCASKSADGLSISFVVIWLAGDALNAAGAMMQGLLGTMVILAVYYCLCDFVLIFQYWYYGKYYQRGAIISTLEADERTPLIANGSMVQGGIEPKDDDQESESWQKIVFKYGCAMLLVIGTGVTAWYISEHTGNDLDMEPQPQNPGDDGNSEIGWRWDAQFYGWLSAILYLSSRFPQIIKNRTTKCQGLSLALFVFAVVGNTTYIASIVLKSSDHDYLLQSASWIVGSLGTVFLDFVVLGQFIVYRNNRREIQRLKKVNNTNAVVSTNYQSSDR